MNRNIEQTLKVVIKDAKNRDFENLKDVYDFACDIYVEDEEDYTIAKAERVLAFLNKLQGILFEMNEDYKKEVEETNAKRETVFQKAVDEGKIQVVHLSNGFNVTVH